MSSEYGEHSGEPTRRIGGTVSNKVEPVVDDIPSPGVDEAIRRLDSKSMSQAIVTCRETITRVSGWSGYEDLVVLYSALLAKLLARKKG